MKRPHLACAAAVLLALLSHVPSALADNRFERANAAYAEARFDEAARELEGLIAERGYSPAALLDLGNAYRRQGETGSAVLAYERARLLAPSDPDLRRSLDAVRAEAGLAVPPTDLLTRAASLWPARRWLAAGVVALVLFCLGALLTGALRRARRAGLLLAVPSFVAVSACAAALWIGTLGVKRAVVMEDAPARVSPFADAEAVTSLRAGEIVRVEDTHGEHVRALLPDGTRGWMARDAVESIVPGALR